jgi:hypothetical protein
MGLRHVLAQLDAVAFAMQCEFKQEFPVVAPVYHLGDSSVSAQPVGPSHDRIRSPAVEPLEAKNSPKNRR